jgi:hypothetical protein
MAEELDQIVAARQRDFRPAGLDRDDAKAGGGGKTLCVDGFGEARWVQLGAQGAGPFTVGVC